MFLNLKINVIELPEDFSDPDDVCRPVENETFFADDHEES